MLDKPRRIVNEQYLDRHRGDRCPMCMFNADHAKRRVSLTEPHHLVSRGAGGSDHTAIALCREHHRMIEGDFEAWKDELSLDALKALCLGLSNYTDELFKELEAHKE